MRDEGSDVAVRDEGSDVGMHAPGPKYAHLIETGWSVPTEQHGPAV